MIDFSSYPVLRALPEGFTESRLAGVRYFKATEYCPKIPLLYDPGVCIVFQGHKVGYLGDRKFRYDPNNYLVVSVTMPFECESFATPDTPLLGLYMDIDAAVLHDLMSRMARRAPWDGEPKGTLPPGIGPAAMDGDMEDAVARLLKTLHSETETRILGPGLVREILFRVLCGEQAPILYALGLHNGHFARIARVVKMIRTDYAQKLDVETMAGQVNMSPSAFHRVFKEITSESPLQYLKKIRLTKARDFLMEQDMKAYMAADRVGYESPSQFSREFKRYFGKTPADMMRELRAA